ncbi:uncharacterized protein LOC121379793 [Gigantopelta aegis]|uniref:uncharacterized protein LOC121379793 n=1 Tax=Gigantopelta aegis TaxID=1735272 RepID=UPI001B889BEC|nr:uncharacterized protein LOC121379793 [Gigantopelta aegis]
MSTSTNPCTAMSCHAKECTYIDVSCHYPQGYICEKPAAAACSPGWRRVGDVCYYKYVQPSLSYITSQYCRDAGFQPVVLSSDAHAAELVVMLGIGTLEYCLTDAILVNDSYIWESTGNATYFNKTWTGSRSKQCISLTGSTSINGPYEKCNTPCIICQYDVNMDFYVDGIQFYLSAQTQTEIQNDITNSQESLSVNKMNCSFSVSSLVGNAVVCNLTDPRSKLTEVMNLSVNGTAIEVKHHLGKTILGVDGAFFIKPSDIDNCLMDITFCANGFTVALWVFIQQQAEYVLFRTHEMANNGIIIRYNNSVLSVTVYEPLYVWQAWSYLATTDWLYVTATWHETLGLSLYINSHLVSTDTKPRQHQREVSSTALILFGVREEGNETSTTSRNDSGVFLKDFLFQENTVWTEREIKKTYGDWHHYYHLSFDEQYAPGWDNMQPVLDDTLTSYTWRNAFFRNALFVNNSGGVATAGRLDDHMLNCFTKPGDGYL